MIPLCVPEIRGNEWKYIKECLDTGWVSSAGSYVNRFEQLFGEYIGARHSVVTVNGTSALHLALKCADVGVGDEVIVPSLTFIAPVNAIAYTGASPVFADCCRDTYVLDPNRVEELIGPNTKAILPVHIYGHPVDMDPLMEIAAKYNITVIEDATESLGSLYKGKQTGTLGHMGCFSFNGNKLITTGGGGMLVTDDSGLGSRAKYLSNQAKSVLPNGSFQHEEAGYNYRMPNLLAAMGVAQLEVLEEYIGIKRKNAEKYGCMLSGIEGIGFPVEKDWARNVHWLYSVTINDVYPLSRDELISKLNEKGIESRPFFMPVHEMPPYKDCRRGNLDVTMELAQKGLNLPSSVGLSEADIDRVCTVISNPV